MIRSIVTLLILIAVPALAQAQSGSAGAERRWSVSTGLGVGVDLGSQTGFLWQLDGEYRFTDSIASTLLMQVVPITGGTVFNMAGNGRYYFGFLRDNSNDFIGNLSPYVGAGIGFSNFSGTSIGPIRIIPGGTEFLFTMNLGLEYDLTDRIGLNSDMRFNINSGPDNFHFTWQLIGARYRF